jgi:thymidylate kinase
MKKIKSRLIAIEGISGVGKSEAKKRLGEHRPDILFVPAVDQIFDEERRILDCTSKDVDKRLEFYLRCIKCASEQAELMLKEYPLVCIESYVYRTLAYHMGMGACTEPSSILETVKLPDIVIMLKCEECVRVKRLLKKRRLAQKKYWDQLSEERIESIVLHYGNFSKMLGFIEVDTSNLTPDQVVQRIIPIIENHENT